MATRTAAALAFKTRTELSLTASRAMVISLTPVSISGTTVSTGTPLANLAILSAGPANGINSRVRGGTFDKSLVDSRHRNDQSCNRIS
jgi:hypothetical protein